MIRSRPLIGPSKLCIIDENLKTLQSHGGLLDENAEEAHNLQSPDCLLDENAEEAHNLHHNLQSPDGLLDENTEEEEYWCYYPHRLRDLGSPVCGIFLSQHLQ